MRAALNLLACLLLSPRLQASRRFNSYAGPFNIVFRECLQCPNDSIETKTALNLTGNWRHSRAFNGMVFDGLLWIGQDVRPGDAGYITESNGGDQFWRHPLSEQAKLHVAKWDSVAGWRENFFRMDGGEYCSIMSLIGREVSEELARIDPRFPTSCPIPKGKYSFKNLTSNQISRYHHFPVFPYGRFRGDLMFYEFKSKLVNSCVRGIADVTPKVRK